jgi:hypothetical protein
MTRVMTFYTLPTLQNVSNIIAQQQSIIDAVESNHSNYSNSQLYELNRFHNNVSALAGCPNGPYVECGC